ncbi:MAG: hypothetical protein M1838_005686, partial [Thelocarpon superellum]
HPQAYVIEEVTDDRHVQASASVRRLRFVRAGVAIFALAAAVAIIGVSADATNVYNQTSVAGQYYLPLWPNRMSTQPATALLASAGIVAFLHATFLAVSYLPGSSARLSLGNAVAAIAAVVGLILGIFSVVYSGILDNSADTYTLRTWTCEWGSLVQTPVADFGHMCAESKAAIGLMIMVVVVEALNLLLAGLGFWMERRARKVRAVEKADFADQRSQRS